MLKFNFLSSNLCRSASPFQYLYPLLRNSKEKLELPCHKNYQLNISLLYSVYQPLINFIYIIKYQIENHIPLCVVFIMSNSRTYVIDNLMLRKCKINNKYYTTYLKLKDCVCKNFLIIYFVGSAVPRSRTYHRVCRHSVNGPAASGNGYSRQPPTFRKQRYLNSPGGTSQEPPSGQECARSRNSLPYLRYVKSLPMLFYKVSTGTAMIQISCKDGYRRG